MAEEWAEVEDRRTLPMSADGASLGPPRALRRRSRQAAGLQASRVWWPARRRRYQGHAYGAIAGRGRPALHDSLLVAVTGVDEAEVGSGEIPIVGDVFDGFKEFEGDESAATAASGKRLSGEDDDFVIATMSLMVNAIETGYRRGVAGTMQTRGFVRKTQDQPQNR